MLAVLKDVYRETVAATTEMVSAIEVFIVHIDTLSSWLSITGRISVANSGLTCVLSVTNTENAVHATYVNSSAFNCTYVNCKQVR